MMDENSQPTETGEDALIPFSWPQQLAFITKELRETLRDRRTIVTLLAMPVLLYPLLGLGFRFVALQEATANKPKFLIGISTDDEAAWLLDEVSLGHQAIEGKSKQDPKPSDSGDGAASPEIDIRKISAASPADYQKLVADGAVDVAVQVGFLVDANRPEKFQGSVRVEIFEDNDRMLSRNAADFLEDRIASASQLRFLEWGKSVNPRFQLPVEQSRTQVNRSSNSSSLVGLLPLILLLMTVTGGVYPAIDLTAGERERNTLETLISIPVPKFRLLFAKFVAVVSVTLLTGLMNLIAMSVTLYALQLDTALLGPNGFTIGLACKLLLALSAFALFYSAVLLMLTSSARSFKEAQAYLIPLLLLSIGPGMVILLPGWKLTIGTAVIPLINILLLSKQFLEGTAELLPAIAAILTTVLYGLAAITVAAQVFGTDAVATGSRGKLFDLLRPKHERQLLPTLSISLIGLAVLFPAYFVVSGVLSRIGDISMVYRVGLSALMTLVLFLGFPLALLRWEKVPVKLGLSLYQPRLLVLIGAVLLGISTWPWIFEIIVSLQGAGLHGIDLSKFEVVQKLLDSWQKVPLALIILGLGVTPGVCEECFFRGFLYNGLKQHLRARTTIIVTAVAFGLFHIVLAGGAAPERILPSTLMGLLLGWLRWRSGSLIPGILLHALHNSTLLAMAKYRDELSGWGLDGVMHQNHLPYSWLGFAAVGFILGFALILISRRNTRPDNAPATNLVPAE